MAQLSFIERLFKEIVNADRAGAADIVTQAFAEGVSPDRVIIDILDPALVQLGVLWAQKSVSLAQTYVAAKIAEDVLLRCLPDPATGALAIRKGTVVIGNIEDDFHSLGRRIVGLFLTATGWDVHDLGNDVTPEQFVDTALKVGATVIGASAMMQTTALNISRLRTLIDERGLSGRIKLAVGGAVFNWRPELVAHVGADGTAHNATEADAIFSRLHDLAVGTNL